MKKPKITENSMKLLEKITELETKTANIIGKEIGIPLHPIEPENIIEVALAHELENRNEIWETYTSKIEKRQKESHKKDTKKEAE